jgi:hypothetical protein
VEAVTSVFDQMRENPSVPVTMTPRAAQDGIDDDGSDDGAGLGASFFLSLGASLGTLTDTLQADQRRRASMEPPGDEQLNAGGTVPSNGILVMDLGSCPLGRVWQVRRIVCGGAQANLTPAGSAFVFRQGAPPSDLNTTNMVDSFPSFSTGAQGSTYGTHQLFLRGGEHLFVVTSGAGSGVRWVCSAQIEDWADASFQSTFSE